MCGWVYVSTVTLSPNSYLFYSAQGSNVNALRVYYDSGTAGPGVWIYAENQAATQYFATVTANTWQHLGMTYDGVNTVRTYHNGVLTGTKTYTLTANPHDVFFTGCLDATTVLENAQLKYWAGYRLSDAEMAAEMGWKGVATARANLLAHWQLENAAPLVDSSGAGNILFGTAATGLQSEPTQPIGVTTLTTPSAFIEGAVQANRGAAVLTTSTRLVEGGASDGMRNGTATLLSATVLQLAGNTLKPQAVTLTTSSRVLGTGTSIKNASTALVTGTQLLPITVTAIKNGAVTLSTTTRLQAAGLIPVFGASALTTSSRLLLSAAKKLNASAQLSTGTTLALVVKMSVAGAVRLESASRISAYSTISQSAPVWFADEPRVTFAAHSQWTSNPSVS